MAIRKVEIAELRDVAARMYAWAAHLDGALDAVEAEGVRSLYLQIDWLQNTAIPSVEEKLTELHYAVQHEAQAIQSGRESPGERKFKRAQQRRKRERK